MDNNEKVIGRPFTKENAAENGKKGGMASGESKRLNKAVAEILREELSKKVGDMTKLEWLTQMAINNTKNAVTLKDIKLMQEILGEAAEKLQVSMGEGMTKDDFIEMIKEARK